MSRKDKLIKSNSIYTLRSKHTSVFDGTIYENDHVTIVRNDGIFSEDVPLFSESNFKFRIGRGNGERRKHSRGGWVEVDGSEGTIWTLNNLPITQQTPDTKIVLKPNYSSIKDFAYYGSAVELIRATVNDVIQRYPGGISYYKNAKQVIVDDTNYYLVSNEFNIDFWTPIGAVCDELENPMRVLGASYMNYEGVTYDNNGNEIETHDIGLNICITGNCLNSIIGKVSFTNNGTISSVSYGESSDNLGRRSLSKGPNVVFGAGEDESEDDDTDGTPDQPTPPQTQDYIDIVCFSGTSANNYFPNTPISNVLVKVTVINSKGVSSRQVEKLSDRNGRARFYISEFNLDGCIESVEVVGIKNEEEFTNSLYVGCEPITQPINLYVHFQEAPQQNKFPFSVYVCDCKTNEPMAAKVRFYAYLMLNPCAIIPEGNANKPFYTNEISTNRSGFAELWSDYTDWYDSSGNSVQNLIEESGSFYITSWKAKAYYEGNEVDTGAYISNETVNQSVCFNNSSQNGVPFTEISVNGIVGTNTLIGEGHRACIYFNSAVDSGRFDGVTDVNGRFSVNAETFIDTYDFVPISYTCEINYNGTPKSSGPHYFFSTQDEPCEYSQTLYFEEEPSIPTKELIVTAYSEYNGVRRVLPGINVTFSANTDKNDCLFTVVKTTNDNGVAIANIPKSIWKSITDCPDTELIDVNEWYVSAQVNGTIVNGEGQPNRLKNGDNTDILVYKETNHWEQIKVIVVDQNYNRLRNAYVTVCATTQTEDSVQGLQYEFYTNKVTDENGEAVFYPSDRWRRFNNAQNKDISDVSFWGCFGSYAGQSETAGPIEIYQWYTNLIITIKETPPVPPYPYTDNCGDINVPEGFYIYLDGNNKKHLLTTNVGQSQHAGQVVIRPKSGFTEEFWSTLDDFEAVLLNRTTKPIFKAKLESPYIENFRHYYRYKNYVWPTVDGVNPDVTSGNFQGYLESLMKIAEYYDEYDSDNLWRMMTHESIKNLDWSFTRNEGDDSIDDIDIDYTRMQAALRVEARLFDDIKRYADNIKTVNNITYDEKNNIPDYFLSDVIEINGFESKNISRFSGEISDVIYSSTTVSGRTDAEVNSDFMRRLALSAEYLMREKGTRRGLEGILGMFGYESGVDYTINEYVAVATNFPEYEETARLRSFGEDEHLNTDDTSFWMEGYPVALVYPGVENMEDYLIPWVNDDYNYLNNIYFQEKGGWGRVNKKDINISITTASEIVEEYGYNLYSETEPYMVYVSNIEELTSLSSAVIYENMVCYVTDISNLYSIYSSQTDFNLVEPITGSSSTASTQPQQNDRTNSNTNTNQAQSLHTARDYSHYFVLKNTMLSNYVGFVHNDLYNCYGWRNIRLHEFNNGQASEDGLRVLYLESIEINRKGNNPHCGYGSYDDGASYIDKFNHIFGSALLSGKYDYLKGGNEEERSAYSAITELGFEIENYCIDNKKCHSFVNDGTQVVYGSSEESERIVYNTTSKEVYSSELAFIGVENIGNGPEVDVEYDDGGYGGYIEESNQPYTFINPESGASYEEAAANSVINVKNLLITFNTNGNNYFKKYLQNTVLTYLHEMIPSTTILRYKFNDGTNETIVSPVNGTHNENEINVIVGDTAVVDNDENNIFLVEDTESLFNNVEN